MEDDYYVDDEQMAPEMAKKKWSEGSLYILDYGDGKQFKIGITTNDPNIRASQIKRNAGMLLPNPLNTALVVHLEMDTNPYYLEQLIQMQYRYKHVGGEWFRFDLDELATIISQIKDFGYLNYHDRWYEMNKDSLGYVLAGVYPADIRYFKDADLFTLPRKFKVSHYAKDENEEAANRLLEELQELKEKNPGTFDDVEIEILPSLESQIERLKERIIKNRDA